MSATASRGAGEKPRMEMEARNLDEVDYLAQSLCFFSVLNFLNGSRVLQPLHHPINL
jgi:hypothetical protein